MAEPAETAENKLRRLRMRSWRRGMKEMDLILGHFADGALSGLGDDDLALYESLLAENDQDLYLWVTRRVTNNPHPDRGPAPLAGLLDRIAAHAGQRLAGDG